MRRLLVLLMACEEAPVALSHGLKGPVAEQLQRCDVRSGSARDWCAFEVLSRSAQSGEQIYGICPQLAQPTRDRCLELTQRVEDPADGAACGEVEDLQVQGSCWLYFADNLAESGELEAGLAVCARTAEMESFCHYHLVQGSIERWKSGDGLSSLETEMGWLISQLESPGRGLIRVIARAAVELGGRPSTDPICQVFGTHTELVRECQSFYREYFVADDMRRIELREGALPSWPR
jgi:hypothetical protein